MIVVSRFDVPEADAAGFLPQAQKALAAFAARPGFLRGLTVVGDHALVTISKPSRPDFHPHPIGPELARRGVQPWCGVLVVDLRTGDIVASIRVEGVTTQLFDVVALPGIACPTLLGPQDMRSEISFDPNALPAKRRRAVRG